MSKLRIILVILVLSTTYAHSETLEVDAYMTPLVEYDLSEEGKEKKVNAKFIEMTSAWHKYRSILDEIKPSVVVHLHQGYGGRLYYFDDKQQNYKRIYIINFKEGGSIKQTIYYKGDQIYLVFHDLGNDSVNDIIQYFQDGTSKYHQRTHNGSMDSGIWY